MTEADLFVGSVLTIYTRQFKITDYADSFTRQALDKMFDRGFILLKPRAVYDNLGKIVQQIQYAGCKITNILMQQLDEHDAQFF